MSERVSRWVPSSSHRLCERRYCTWAFWPYSGSTSGSGSRAPLVLREPRFAQMCLLARKTTRLEALQRIAGVPDISHIPPNRAAACCSKFRVRVRSKARKPKAGEGVASDEHSFQSKKDSEVRSPRIPDWPSFTKFQTAARQFTIARQISCVESWSGCCPAARWIMSTAH